jgi:hypothetical protein
MTSVVCERGRRREWLWTRSSLVRRATDRSEARDLWEARLVQTMRRRAGPANSRLASPPAAGRAGPSPRRGEPPVRIVPLAKALEYVRGLPCWQGDDLDHVLGETPRKLFGF